MAPSSFPPAITVLAPDIRYPFQNAISANRCPVTHGHYFMATGVFCAGSVPGVGMKEASVMVY